MWERFKTAVVAVVAVLVLLLAVPQIYVFPVILLVICVAAWEWSVLAGFSALASRLFYVGLIAAGALLYWPGLFELPVRPLLWLTGLWWLSALVMIFLYPLRIPKAVIFVGGFLTLVPAFFALVALLRYPETGAINGPALLLFVLANIFGTDIGGYFAGRFLGKRKLAPAVSPKKTWAGVGGGLIMAVLIGLAGSAVFELAWFRLVPLCLLTGMISIVGDLTVSLFKREAGVKDSGTIFPGHGGILDRLDSIAAAAPLFVAGIMFGHGPW
ncbi:MAG: phosphatidate cytidylyltransferase [Woeseiaceae bacterium]